MPTTVTFETAQLAHKKSFRWHTPLFYATEEFANVYQDKSATYTKGETGTYRFLDGNNHPIINAPTQALLKKWLRERHGLYVEVEIPWFSVGANIVIDEREGFGWWIAGNGIYEETSPEDNLKNYEKALEKGLQKALKIILEDSNGS